MALSEMEISIVSRRHTQTKDKTAQKDAPRTLFTQRELTDMMIHPPEGLSAETPVHTPAGTWSMENGLAEFNPKDPRELSRITAPDKSIRRKLVKIFQM